MTELLTAEQMRMIEKAAIDSGEVSGLDLMERAGKAVVDAILEEWPLYRDAPQSATILCGPGNNGGDGFVVARLLKDQDWNVRVLFYGNADSLPKDARINHDIWAAFGPIEPLTLASLKRNAATIYVDALFGTGLSRPLEGEALAVVNHLANRQGDDLKEDTVAIDAPSGLCMDSGRFLCSGKARTARPIERFAHMTVAFDSPKAGHFIARGPELCGRLVIRDIGLENWRCFTPEKGAATGSAPFSVKGGVASGIARPARLRLVARNRLVADPRRQSMGLPPLAGLAKGGEGAHKYSHGHALVISGPASQGGAARLAARAALRIGTGLVTVCSPQSALAEHAAQLNAIMLRAVETPADLKGILGDRRIRAVCLGPGMGVGRDARAMVTAACKAAGKSDGPALVLDADALTGFADDPKALFGLLGASCILTPHMGEFARLFADIAQKLDAAPVQGPAYSKVDAVREAAGRAGCIVLLKGADTVIAAPNGNALVHAAAYDRRAPWLATAGSGDVLAGFITGLLARGLPPLDAAASATWLHVEAARRFGPGLIAEDLPEILPEVFRGLGL